MTQFAPRKRAKLKKPAAKKAAVPKPAKKTAAPKPAKQTKAQAAAEPPNAVPPPAQLNVPSKAVDAWMAMTAKQQKFCELYLASGDKEAAAAAVYSGGLRSNKVLSMPAIAAFLRAMAAKKVEEVEASNEWIRNQFILEARTAVEGSVRVRALENLAELNAMYPAKNVKHDVSPALADLFGTLDSELGDTNTGLPPTKSDAAPVRH